MTMPYGCGHFWDNYAIKRNGDEERNRMATVTEEEKRELEMQAKEVCELVRGLAVAFEQEGYIAPAVWIPMLSVAVDICATQKFDRARLHKMVDDYFNAASERNAARKAGGQ